MRSILVAIVAVCSAYMLIPSDVFAQDYRPGYIIKNNMDSVSGYIEYATERKNVSYCHFRSSRKGESSKFTADKLQAYGFYGDKEYKSIYLPGYTPNEKVFVKELANGPMGLYQHWQTFIVKKDSFILLPAPKKEFIDSDHGKMLKQDLRYKGLLNFLVADCKLVTDDIKYNEDDLVDLVDEYNRCKGFKAPVTKHKPMFKVNFDVFGGYVASKLRVTGVDDPTTFNVSHTVTGGFGIDISSPRVFDRIFITVDLSYVNNIYQLHTVEPASGGMNNREISMNFTSIKVPFGFRYNFLRTENTPYIKIGFTTSYLRESEIKTFEALESSDGNVLVTQHSTGGYSLQKNPKAFWMGLGYNKQIYNKLQIFGEVWFDHGGSFIGTQTNSYSDVRNISMLLGIRF